MPREEAIAAYKKAVDECHDAFVRLPEDEKLKLLVAWTEGGSSTLALAYMRSWRDHAVKAAEDQTITASLAREMGDMCSQAQAKVEDELLQPSNTMFLPRADGRWRKRSDGSYATVARLEIDTLNQVWVVFYSNGHEYRLSLGRFWQEYTQKEDLTQAAPTTVDPRTTITRDTVLEVGQRWANTSDPEPFRTITGVENGPAPRLVSFTRSDGSGSFSMEVGMFLKSYEGWRLLAEAAPVDGQEPEAVEETDPDPRQKLQHDTVLAPEQRWESSRNPAVSLVVKHVSGGSEPVIVTYHHSETAGPFYMEIRKFRDYYAGWRLAAW